MSSKHERIAALAASFVGGGLDPRYAGYFVLFNRQQFYEAHDVLEHLWLKDGRDAPNYAFYKGLIQLAGGFVHLRLQHLNPHHPKYGRRLHPARRLFLLAETNLTPYGPLHHGLELEPVLTLCRNMSGVLEQSDCSENPWASGFLPSLPNPIARKASD